MDWNRSIGLFLEKEIHKQIHLAGNIGYRALRQNLKPPPPKLDPWNQFYRTIQGLKTTLEQILKEYNPLYDLNVKFPKIEDL